MTYMLGSMLGSNPRVFLGVTTRNGIQPGFVRELVSPTTSLPQFSPPCLGAAIFSLIKPHFHFNFEKSISLVSLPLHSGEAKQQWESFFSVVFYSSSSQQIKLTAV
jgi:hypothetical protein